MRKLNGIMVGCVVGWLAQACSPTLSASDDGAAGETGETGKSTSRGGSGNGGGASGKYSAVSSVSAARGGSSSTSSSSGGGMVESSQGGTSGSVNVSSAAGGEVSAAVGGAENGGSSPIEGSKSESGGSNTSGGSSVIGAGGISSAGGSSARGGSSTVGGSSVVAAGGTSSSGGSSARGGTTSVGGTTASLRANGQVCQSHGQCSSNHCADGYCCNSACDGPCTTCSATPGTCTKPATDTACIGTVSCPADTACIDYTLLSTSGECSSLGVCAQNCGQVYAPARTSCSSDGALCNGLGQCTRPQVTCGTGAFEATCSTAPGKCCRGWAAGSTAANPSPGQAYCAATVEEFCSAPPSGLGRVQFRCDGPEDCALGSVCCAQYTATGFQSSCRLPGDCSGVVPSSLLCHSNADCAVWSGYVCGDGTPAYSAYYPDVRICYKP